MNRSFLGMPDCLTASPTTMSPLCILRGIDELAADSQSLKTGRCHVVDLVHAEAEERHRIACERRHGEYARAVNLHGIDVSGASGEGWRLKAARHAGAVS